uniref:Aspartokinase n=1 Tax=uncultured marine thaumarchaeote KM3_156_A10 TaxID=1456021 RepID=A0A075GE10_9ARCH|nr:aspartate kinase (lysC) [uncultured marine thaumarchaeote KM3_156_A10]
MKLVLKYGGTSLSSPSDIRNVAKNVASLAKNNEIVVVCSAIDGVTDDLIRISTMIEQRNKNDATKILDNVIKKHKQFANQTIKSSTIKKQLLEKLNIDVLELQELVRGLTLLKEVSTRSLDYLISFGERLSDDLVSFSLQDLKNKSTALNGKEVGIVTDSNFGESRPLMDTTRIRISKTLSSLLSKKIIPVVGGFAGADQHGNITTFGRGGSDYTATIIASCINADEIWLMSDVEGLMTADPKLVKNARLLNEVSYAEAIEMAQFGAKQIHPRTFEPILSKKIPMRIRSTFDTKNTGTIVTASPSARTKRTVKCVSAIRNIGLIDLSGGITFAAPGTAAKIFTTLAEKNVNVLMVSSNPSESSLSLIVKKSDLEKAVTSLEMNLLGKTVKKIDATPSVSIVAVIGSGMRGTVGVASKVFSAAHKVNANVMMIAQGSSELNLAFVVKDSDCKSVVQSLHTEFKLDKIN